MSNITSSTARKPKVVVEFDYENCTDERATGAEIHEWIVENGTGVVDLGLGILFGYPKKKRAPRSA